MGKKVRLGLGIAGVVCLLLVTLVFVVARLALSGAEDRRAEMKRDLAAVEQELERVYEKHPELEHRKQARDELMVCLQTVEEQEAEADEAAP